MVNSRTDGAPSLPITTEEQRWLDKLREMEAAGEITPAFRRQKERELAARREESYAWLRRKYEREQQQGQQPPAAATTTGMPGPMTGTTEDYQAFMGMTPDPLAGPLAEAQQQNDGIQYGRRVGGGEAFGSEAEAAEYGRRRPLTGAQEDELRAKGVPEQEIKDMQRSQFDRDMAQAGYTGGTGWVPVLGPEGRYTYMERAPSPAWGEIGATDTAVGGPRRVGPRADAGEVPRMLSRPDLERRGYEAVALEGPYGMEYVYRAENISADMEQRLREDYGFTDEQIESFKLGGNDGANAYQAASRAMADQRRREGMAARAGVPLRNADGTQRSNMELRQLIRENRQAQLDQRKEVARRARMASRPRNELGLMQLSDKNLSDWERAALFAQITDDVEGVQNMTPLGVQAQNMQNAWQLAQAAMEGGAAASTESMRQQAALASTTGPDAVRLSIQRGESMGNGLSAGHVQSRYRYWFMDPGPSSPQRREREFRREMEGLGYTTPQIDAYLDDQRNQGNVPPPLPPSATDPSMLPPM